ncbi:unnamed protein product [Auanema sp. JU1783]|nr:unnamed protein product [Auanema sp. JU1783]
MNWLRSAAVFLLVIVVLEACHSHVVVGRSKKLVPCKSKKREGKKCYYYSKGEYTHNHEHTHGSHGSHEHGHPGGSSQSSDIVSTEEDISLECPKSGCGSGSGSGGSGGSGGSDGGSIDVDEEGYVICEEDEVIEDIIGTCSAGCGAYELQATLCPVGSDCDGEDGLLSKVVTEEVDGCLTLACEDSDYSLGVLGINGEISLDAVSLTCHKEIWYRKVDTITAIQFGEEVKLVCYKL